MAIKFNSEVPFNAPVTFNGDVLTMAFDPSIEVLVVNEKPNYRVLKKLRLAPAVLPTQTAFVAVDLDLDARGGAAPYTFQLLPEENDRRPSGLDFAAGHLSGELRQAGAFSWRVAITDAAGDSALRWAYLTVLPSIHTEDLANAAGGVFASAAPIGVAYFSQLLILGGVEPFTVALAPGDALPPGLALSTPSAHSFALAGTPTVLGTYTFDVVGTDADGNAYTIATTVNVT